MAFHVLSFASNFISRDESFLHFNDCLLLFLELFVNIKTLV